MTAQPVATMSSAVKAPTAQAQGGRGATSFINYLGNSGSADFKSANGSGNGTKLATISHFRKLTTKNAQGDDSSAASNQNNAPTTANALPLSVPTDAANDPAAIKDAGTTSGGDTTGLANTTGDRASLLAAPLGNGATVALGTGTPATRNKFAGLINAGITTAPAANQIPAATAPTSATAAPQDASQASLAAASLAANQATAPITPNTATPTVTPPGTPTANSALRQAGPSPTTYMVNQFGAPGATSASDPTANAATNDPNSKTSASSDPTQSNASGSVAGTTDITTLPGAAALNARVVAGATDLSVHPSQAASAATAAMAQSTDANAGMTPPGTGTAGLPDKGRNIAGIAPGSANGAAPGGTPATAANAATDPRSFSAALDHATSQGHDTTPDATADDAKSGSLPNTDAGSTPSSDTTLLAAQNSPTTNSSNAAPTDAGLRPALIALPASEQVAINLKQALKTGSDEIQIQLKPASLGTIDVKLNVNHDGRLSAVISADRSDTLNLLKQDSSNLQQSLRDAGFNADSGSLSFNLRGDSQSFAQNAAPQTPMTNSARTFSDLPIASTLSRTLRQHLGAVDIQV